MRQRSETDELIDRFVTKINRSPRTRIREEDIPVVLRRGGARYGLYYSWTIQRFSHIRWIELLERELPRPLPPSYRSLVTRYLFPAFEAGPLMLLANTGQALYNEMSMAMMRDKVFSRPLLKVGFAQFARPFLGDFDPICFDFNRCGPDGEAPIVRLDHRPILLGRRMMITEEIAPSFKDFVQRFLGVREASVISQRR